MKDRPERKENRIMKLLISILTAALFLVSLSAVALASEQGFSIRGPIVSIDSGMKSLTVESIEGTTTAANNRWQGDIVLAVTDMTKIAMGSMGERLSDLRKGENVKVLFHRTNGKLFADDIEIVSN